MLLTTVEFEDFVPQSSDYQNYTAGAAAAGYRGKGSKYSTPGGLRSSAIEQISAKSLQREML